MSSTDTGSRGRDFPAIAPETRQALIDVFNQPLAEMRRTQGHGMPCPSN